MRFTLNHPAALLLPVCLALPITANAEVPEKRPLTYYSRLWNDSPFTSKPPPPRPVAQANPLEGLVLVGVSPILGGHRVTIVEKKNPSQRIYVSSDEPTAKHGFRILGVERAPGDPMATTVKLSKGPNVGTVAYDEKTLKLATPKPPQPIAPGTRLPNQPVDGRMINRQPRPRVIPPPSQNQQQQMQGNQGNR